MNENTVFNIFEANQKEKNMIINMKCFAYIEKNHQKCFKKNEFLHMSSELLRLILHGCKLPENVAKQAISSWSAHPDNGSEDIDELMALTSLNEGPEVTSEKQKNTKKKPPSAAQQLATQLQQTVMHSLFFRGNIINKSFQIAVVTLVTSSQPVIISEMEFISGPSKKNNEVVITINDISPTNNNYLWTDAIKCDKGEFTHYILPKPCEIAARRDIIITISFTTNESRKSLDSSTLSNNTTSTFGGLELRASSILASTYGHVLWRIGYK